jgi:predicted SprT family Zn-dependent metalloprotease
LWSKKWSTPWLAKDVKVAFSDRLTKSLGRCKPLSKEIRLNTELLTIDRSELLLEVLCHEAAHIVNYARHGRLVKPHGIEWQTLMNTIGYQPRRMISIKQLEISSVHQRGVFIYEHRCPVCQNVRYAKKPINRWRCGFCLALGLSGDLLIVKRERKTGDQNES